jgi:prolyl-tRNA editing enzyme YbaK/EbsC (Cys-tRNA(Pro) deacylase)
MPDYSTTGAVFPLKTYAITDVDTGTEQFVIDGDQTERFQDGDEFSVVGSTGNDGAYTVASTSYSEVNDETTITVNEDITDATVDGTIVHREVADSLPITEAHDDADDRDAAAPEEYAGAHGRRLANELRALGKTVGEAIGLEVVDGGGLVIYYTGSKVLKGSGTPVFVPPGTLTMTDNDDNYVEVDIAGTVSSNTVGFTTGKYPLAIVTTVASVITAIVDTRSAIYLAEFAEANLDDFGPSFNAGTELTIAAGVVTRTQGVHLIDTEADAASDDLDTISGGAADMMLILRAINAARTVVLKDGTGNLELGGSDITLDDTDRFVFLLYDGTLSKWVLVGQTDVDLSAFLKADGSVDIVNSVYNAAAELTIAAGVITRTQAIHRVDTEGDAASDDLVTISGGADGMIVILRAENAARTVVIKETGNIALGGSDITLDDINKMVMLYYETAVSKWLLIGGAGIDTSGFLQADGSVDIINSVYNTAAELTIAAGVITRTQAVHRVDTEADAASDDLVTISGGADGLIVIIRAENAARTVVIKETGNIALGGSDITLDDINKMVMLYYEAAVSKWLLIGGAGVDTTGFLKADGSVDIINSVYNASTELTIASGIITRTQAVHRVDTEADAASDDLVTINGGADGLVVRLRAENAARTVVIKETGNIELGGQDIALDDTDQYIALQYDGTLSKWLLVGQPGEVIPGEPVVFEIGHGEIVDTLSNEEFHRFQLQAGEVFTLTRLELQQKGGGSVGTVSVNVYDSTGASQLDSVTMGSVSVSGGTSVAAALILVRVSNSSGGDVNGTIIVRGYITPAPEYVALEMGHGEIPDGLSNEEIHRFQLQGGETFTLERLELQLKGGGTNINVSVNVYDSTGASQIDSVTAGSVSVTGGASGVASLILVRLTNSSGGDVNGTIIVRGKITS